MTWICSLEKHEPLSEFVSRFNPMAKEHLIVGLTGASGAFATKLLLERSTWPITLITSQMGRVVYEQEVGPLAELEKKATMVWDDADLTAPIASGSVLTAGMVLLPCSANTLGKMGAGIADSLITRAAHCQLKEGRKTVFCVREAPWTLMNIRSAESIVLAGGTIMPLSPPFYMTKDRNPNQVSMTEILTHYVDHLLAFFGQEPNKTWSDIREEG